MKGKIIALLAAFLVSGTAGVLVTSNVPAQATSVNSVSLISKSNCTAQNSTVSAALQNALKAAAAQTASNCPSSAAKAATSASNPQACAKNTTCSKNLVCAKNANSSCAQNSCYVVNGKVCTTGSNCGNLNSLLQSLQSNCSKTPTASSKPSTTTSKAPTSSSSKGSTSASSKPVSSTPTASAYSSFQNQVVQLVNQQRAANGLGALSVDSGLTKTATLKSQDMAKLGYFDHTSPTYGSPFDMMKQFGITYRSAGENIAMGQTSPQQVMNAWMNSPGHRANILNSSFTKIGVGIAQSSDGRYYWTQQFIG